MNRKTMLWIIIVLLIINLLVSFIEVKIYRVEDCAPCDSCCSFYSNDCEDINSWYRYCNYNWSSISNYMGKSVTINCSGDIK